MIQQRAAGRSHRHLRLADVLDFHARRERSREATQAINEIVEEHDLPYWQL